MKGDLSGERCALQGMSVIQGPAETATAKCDLEGERGPGGQTIRDAVDPGAQKTAESSGLVEVVGDTTCKD